MRVLSEGIDEFPEIRSNPESLYVDKTKLVARLGALLLGRRPQLFLSRPRRFGKTLLVSTLEALFQGRRDLFQDTWIGQDGRWNWERHRYPVMRLDMSIKNALSREELAWALRSKVIDESEIQGVEVNEALSTDTLLARLIRELSRQHNGQRVAVLIDEYDTPITEVADRPAAAPDILALMRAFYGVLKSSRKHMRCVFMTGITRVAHAGLFAGANHFSDVSFDPDFNALLGFTHRELRTVPELQADIERCARTLGCSAQVMERALRRQYNGYQFSKKAQKVYNPYALALCFEKFRAKKGVAWRLDEMPRAWSHSGTPYLLFRLWRAGGQASKPLADTGGMDALAFLEHARYDAARPNMTALMYQAGYLTLARARKADPPDALRLDFPNQEVRQAYCAHLQQWQGEEVAAWHAEEVAGGLRGAAPIRDALLAGNARALVASIDNHLQRFSYPIHAVPGPMKSDYDYETHYRTLLCSALASVGLHVQVEVSTLRGRIDILVESEDQILCLECKTDRAPVYALRQAWDKGYVDAYRQSGKFVTAFGLSFNTETRTISDAAVWPLGKYDLKRERWASEPFTRPEHTLTALRRMGHRKRKRIVDAWSIPDPRASGPTAK